MYVHSKAQSDATSAPHVTFLNSVIVLQEVYSQNGGGAVTKNKDLVTSLHVCHAQNPEMKIVKPATRKTLSANTLS